VKYVAWKKWSEMLPWLAVQIAPYGCYFNRQNPSDVHCSVTTTTKTCHILSTGRSNISPISQSQEKKNTKQTYHGSLAAYLEKTYLASVSPPEANGSHERPR
jgi:hypothetical protein